MDEVIDYLEAQTGRHWGADKFGYMESVGQNSGRIGDSGTALEMAAAEGRYQEGRDAEKSDLPILPILLGAIGFGVGGLGGGAAGFVMGQLLMGEKDKSSPGQRTETIEELTTGTIPTGRG